ncbi:MAG: MarP family serine protease [Streptosporangiaceae bacterium]
MKGDLLDLVLVLLAVGFGISGLRQGFIVGVLSFAGFLGGGVVGATVAPDIAARIAGGATQEALVAIFAVFVAATLGQFITSSVGAAVRSRVTWRPARFFDALGGAVASIVSLLLIAWLIGTAVANSPFTSLAFQVRHSQVLRSVDQVIPSYARTWFASFRRLVDQNTFPPVFGDLGPTRITEVKPPSKSVIHDPDIRLARRSIVKVVGTAPGCSRRIEGTGFVYAPHHVMTNAHVVAGVRGGPRVISATGDETHHARVVLYDPNRDLAVLYVPQLSRRPLEFNGSADSGDAAVVAGYPHNHGFTIVPARVRGEQRATGPNIYQTHQVTRDIYALRAKVEPGNSGGPLLTADGGVYGVVFAAAVDDPDTGYALTAQEVASDARSGADNTEPVSTQSCD